VGTSYCLVAALPAILVPRHTTPSEDCQSSLFPSAGSGGELSSSVPENTQFPSPVGGGGPCSNNLSTLLQHSPITSPTLESTRPLPTTETPPPGYMSEDGDNVDHNDNMSKFEILQLSLSKACLNL
jgi:MAD (mothers against decapentaplegic) family protein 2/3